MLYAAVLDLNEVDILTPTVVGILSEVAMYNALTVGNRISFVTRLFNILVTV